MTVETFLSLGRQLFRRDLALIASMRFLFLLNRGHEVPFPSHVRERIAQPDNYKSLRPPSQIRLSFVFSRHDFLSLLVASKRTSEADLILSSQVALDSDFLHSPSHTLLRFVLRLVCGNKSLLTFILLSSAGWSLRQNSSRSLDSTSDLVRLLPLALLLRFCRLHVVA